MKSWFVRILLSVMLLVAMYLPVSGSVPAEVCTWTGAVDDDWHNGGNWDCGHAPGPNDSVIVAMGDDPSYIRGTATAGSVTVNGGATLGLLSGQTLTVGSGFTVGPFSELMLGSGSAITLQNGDWTDNGAFIPGADPWTLILDGQGNQAITGAKSAQSFQNLTLRNMNMGLPVFNTGPNVQQVTVGGTLTLGGDTTFNAGSTAVQVGGDWLNNGATFLGSGGVTFTGGNDQLIGGTAPNQTFPGPVTVNKSGGILSLGPHVNGVTFTGPLVVSGGTLRLGGKPMTTNDTTTIGPGTLDLGAGGRWTANDTVTLGSGGTFRPRNGTLTLGNGNWTNNQGTVENTELWMMNVNSTSKVWINGTATTQSFGNLEFNNPAMGMPAVQVGESTTQVNIGGTVIFGADTTFNTGPADVQVGGDWLNNGGAYQGSGGVAFVGGNDQLIGGTATSQTFPGDLTLAKPGGGVSLGGSTTQVNVNGAFNVFGGAFNVGAGTLTTRGPATIRQTGTLNLGTGAWNSGACIFLQTGGTIAPGSGTLNFRGGTFGLFGGILGVGNWTANFLLTGPQEISGFGAPVFNNVGVYNATMGGPPPALYVGSPGGGGPTEMQINGDLKIGPNTTLVPIYRLLLLKGSIENHGTYVPGKETTVFVGSSPRASAFGLAAAQVITGSKPITFNNLTIDNPDGVTLGASQAVSGTLYLKAGDLSTNAFTLTLSSAATVTGTRDVVGTVQRTHVFTPGVPFSFNHRFTSLTFADPGALTGVAMTMQKAAPVGLTPAVTRTYTITPSGAGYTATLRLAYQDAELGGIPEADLRLWRRSGAWGLQGRSAGDAAANWVELNGVTAFSAWALAPEATSPTRRIYLPLIQRP